MRVFLLFWGVFYFCISGICQDGNAGAFRNQLTFLCDNNFFLFNGEDGYYTSGLFLKYDRLSAKPFKGSKRIFSFEAGQLIYNAHARKILPVNQSNFPEGVDQIDRPIAGYLFVKASGSLFYSNNSMLKLGAFVGSTGRYSFAEDVQEFWHRVIGVKDYWNWIWDYQVNTEWSANVQGEFAKSLLAANQSIFQITPTTQATLGTAFTNVSQALLFQFGRLRPMTSSSYWNSRLQVAGTNDHPIEVFIFYQPKISYQLYNATIQGGLFIADKGPIISDIKSFVFSQEAGIRFSTTRYCFGYHLTFQTREAANQFYRQSFGSIMGAVRF